MRWTVMRVLLVGLSAITLRASAAPPPVTAAPAVCRGVPHAERYVYLLTERQDVVRVEQIEPQETLSEAAPADPRAGARIVLAARPGVTAEWLERIGECHVAQQAARGYPRSADPSALDVKGATVHVASWGDSFTVDITTLDNKAAREILLRARALVSPPRAP